MPAVAHDKHNPDFSDGDISQSEAQQLARRLTKQKRELERKDETIKHLSERNQELNAQNERLRESLDSAYVMMDRYADEVSDDAYQLLESIFIDALNDGGDADA